MKIKGMLALATCMALASCRPEQAAPGPKPDLALLTSLPIVFGEQFGLDNPKNEILTALEERFTVRPIDGPEQLSKGGTLLAVQPQALTAERLVRLDRWVRDGGRLVLLADPKLAWESERPLGDTFRPPYSFPDTGLLRHWGLTLSATGKDGPVEREVNGVAVSAASPGALVASGTGCRVDGAGFVAHCRIGAGSAIVVADADWLLAFSPDAPDGRSDPRFAALLKLLAP